ncbi:unnamed protein product [Hermetia illucens]|uniref:CRAL-TRIO domain-containing protein n=3 Tax=Hermetia illucens TaxID=343691 RepID=A0A7R8YXT8_HERIL|nr:unnamed protein product [Hermetia illucens]
MAALKFGFMVCDRYFVEDDYFSIGGYSVLFDMDGFSTKHMAGLTVPTLRELAECMKLGYPIRHRGIHYINCPTGFDVLLRLFRNFLPTKLANVIHTHSDFESVYEHFPKSCLPAEYGGNLGTLREITSDFLEKYLSSREWFDEDSKYRCDETKRQGASRIPNDLFGVDGSFKKLEID